MDFFKKLTHKISVFKDDRKERGMTMIEIVIVVVALGILASIAYPSFTAVQNQVHENNVKTAISRAALLMEQEAIDNNGLVPRYVPNEVLDDEILSKFSYSHKDRLRWCITAKIDKNSLIPWGPDTAEVWFSSSEKKEASKEACGNGYELLEGSSTPWKVPTVTTPAFSTYKTTWAIADASAKAFATSTSSLCVFTSEDDATWSSQTSMSYALRVTNLTGTRNTDTYTSEWTTNPADLNIQKLTGAWPDDNVKFEIRSRCTITTGVPYQYYSDWSTPQQSTVVRYTVPTPAFPADSPVLNIKSGGPSVRSTVKANWPVAATCPSPSTRNYTLKVTANGKSTGLQISTPPIADAALDATLIPGYDHKYDLQMSCEYPNSGPKLSSVTSSKTQATNLRPPLTTTAITSSMVTNSNLPFTPNTFAWNNTGVQCTYGTLMHGITVLPNNNWVAAEFQEDYTPTTFSLSGNQGVGTNIKLSVSTYCKGIINSTLKTSADADAIKTVDVTLNGLKPSSPKGGTLAVSSQGGTFFKYNSVDLNSATCETGATLAGNVYKTKNSNSAPETMVDIGYLLNLRGTNNYYGIVDDSELNWLANQTYRVDYWCNKDGQDSDIITKTVGMYNTPTIPTSSTWGNTLVTDNDQSVKWGLDTTCPATTVPNVRISMTTMNGTAQTTPPTATEPLSVGKATITTHRVSAGTSNTMTALLYCQGLDASVNVTTKTMTYTKPNQRLYPGSFGATWTDALVMYTPAEGSTSAVVSPKSLAFANSTGWTGMKNYIVTDYNGDGILDIVATWSTGHAWAGRMNYYPGAIGGGFSPSVWLSGTTWNTVDIAMASGWGQDSTAGNPDPSKPTILSKDATSNIYSYSYNGATKATTYALPATGSTITMSTASLHSMDVNNDNVPDLVLRSGANIATLTHTINNGTHSLNSVAAGLASYPALDPATTKLVRAANGYQVPDLKSPNFSGLISTSSTNTVRYNAQNRANGTFGALTTIGTSGWNPVSMTDSAWGWEAYPGYIP